MIVMKIEALDRDYFRYGFLKRFGDGLKLAIIEGQINRKIVLSATGSNTDPDPDLPHHLIFKLPVMAIILISFLQLTTKHILLGSG